jgi:hypothetical protein
LRRKGKGHTLVSCWVRPHLIEQWCIGGASRDSSDKRVMQAKADHRGLKRYFRLPPLQTIVFVITGLAAVALVWGTGRNANLLYITYLTCSYIILQLVISPLSLRFAALVPFLFFLLYSPRPIPAFPEETKISGGPWQPNGTVLPGGATRSYRFLLAPLRARQPACGTLQRADIFVHGKPADGDTIAPVLSIDNGTIVGQSQSPFYNGLIILHGRAEFAGALPGEARVELHNRGREPFSIFRGPELAGGRVYPEAVFMTFDSAECHIVVHANPVD